MYFKHAITKVLVSMMALLLPFASSAVDATITSFELATQGSAVQGATADYVFAIELSQTVPSGTTVSVLTNLPGQDSLDMSKLLSFSGATFSSSTLTFTGSTSSMGSAVYELFLTADAAAGKHTLSATGVVNPSAGVCLVTAATTQSLESGDSITSGLTGFVIGNGDCSSEGDDVGNGNGDDGPVDDAFVLTAVGNNIVVQWEAYTGVATYGLSLDLDDNMENGNVTGVSDLTDTTYVFSDLDADTTYYVPVNGNDADGNQVIVPYPAESVETGSALDSRTPNTPTVKKIKSTEARVQWDAYSAVEQAYLSKIVIRVKKGKKKIKNASVDSTVTKKKVKELKPATEYMVQVREVWNINDTTTKTKWSKKKTFTTKKK